MKKKIIITIMFSMGLFSILFFLNSNKSSNQDNKKTTYINKKNIKSQDTSNIEKNTKNSTYIDNYDYLSLPSVQVNKITTKSGVLNFEIESSSASKVSLVDVYTNKQEKEFPIKNNKVEIKLKDVNTLGSRYDLLLKEEKWKKLKLNKKEIKIENGFGIINNEGFEISFGQIFVDYDKEEDLFFKSLNQYRKSKGINKVKRMKSIDKLSKQRVKDEVSEKKYNFHYTKSTGYSNIALLNEGIVKSNCDKNKNFEAIKYCNFKLKEKNFNVNIHSNDFEQITRGIIFAYTNLAALKISPIHNTDLISKEKNYIGIGMFGNYNFRKLNTEIIKVYGPKLDHTASQASSAYINNVFSNGIKSPENQEKSKSRWLNVALSFYML